MEPGVREYLLRIVNTISFGLLWMVSNSTIGIMYKWAFIEDRIRWQHLAFYGYLLLSFAALLWYIIRLWKKPIDYDQG